MVRKSRVLFFHTVDGPNHILLLTASVPMMRCGTVVCVLDVCGPKPQHRLLLVGGSDVSTHPCSAADSQGK